MNLPTVDSRITFHDSECDGLDKIDNLILPHLVGETVRVSLKPHPTGNVLERVESFYNLRHWLSAQ